MAFFTWWVWRSWLARQIVALEALGSSPSTHLIGLSPSGKATAFDAVIPLVRIQLALLGRRIKLYMQIRLRRWATSSGGRALDF